MEKNLYIDASHQMKHESYLNQIIQQNKRFEDKNNLNFKNNIYLATISRVEPSLQAALLILKRTTWVFQLNDIQSNISITSEDKEKLEAEENQRRTKREN